MYREDTPAADPFGLIACVWTRQARSHYEQRVVPDACVDIVWHRATGALFVAGPDTRGYVTPIEPGSMIGLRFSPGSSPVALNASADSIRDGRVPLDALWTPAQARQLAGQLAETGTDGAAQRLLERSVTAHAGGVRDRAATGILRLLRDGTPVGEMAEAIGLSERQLHRRSLAAFGYGPKVLDRVLRFDRAFRLARGGVALADVAYEVGYADQSHLSRETKSLSGVPMRTLVRS